MNTREQSAANKKTVVENATRELVLEHVCELVETFPVSKEKALILSVIRSWDSLDSITKKKVNDRIKAIAEVYLDLIGESSEIDEVFSLIFQSGEKKISDWFHLLWRGSLGRVDNSPKLYNFYHFKIIKSITFAKSDVLV